jgi:hypothetical protein
MPINQIPSEKHEALYVPKRIAKGYEDQKALNDLYGRRCTVEETAIGYGGATGFDKAFYVVDGHSGMHMFRVGKKESGRALDGVIHDATPSF